MASNHPWTDYDHERQSWYYYDSVKRVYVYAAGYEIAPSNVQYVPRIPTYSVPLC